MHQNSIMVVKPYKWEGMWVFDDEKTGLLREPLAAGSIFRGCIVCFFTI